MLPKQGFFLFCANVFLSSANLAVKELGRCCCHRAFGFPGRAGDALGPETKPRGTTANLSPLPNFLLASYQSSLLFKLQGSHSACLGVEFILNKCFVWLAVFYLYIKKKKVSHWHSKLDFIENSLCAVFLENCKSGNTSQLGNVLRAEEKLPLCSPAVPTVSPSWPPPPLGNLPVSSGYWVSDLALPAQGWEPKWGGRDDKATHPSPPSFPSSRQGEKADEPRVLLEWDSDSPGWEQSVCIWDVFPERRIKSYIRKRNHVKC